MTFTVNIMTFTVAISQWYYNVAGSGSENAAGKQLNTNHVPCTAVQYKYMEARRGMHSGDKDDRSISSVWQRSVCVW
jgi:hypothetical protein